MKIRTKINRNLYMILVLVLFFITSKSMALETDTHRAINEYIAQNNNLNGFSLDSYLKNHLRMQNGKDTFFNHQEVFKWIRDGGEYEDKPPWCIPYLRSRNHFHNPIDNSGFSGGWDTDFLSGISAVNWALQPVNSQSWGNYSWDDIRSYYHNALTGRFKATRETNFAETFRGLGRLCIWFKICPYRNMHATTAIIFFMIMKNG